MTPEEKRSLLMVVGANHPLGAKRIADHIAALEAEAARLADIAARSALLARERALEEVKRELVAQADSYGTRTMDQARGAMALAIKTIDALKSKPAQEVLCVHGAGEGVECYACHPHPVEMASEENGLLPKRRRRDHDYGEEHRGIFGEYVAHCTRPMCQAHRIKTRTRDATMFRQSNLSDTTSDPGPCEVEP